jgi:16S rRNA (adenine1518-N6/adenine1519-N6)-dimethyltransferase
MSRYFAAKRRSVIGAGEGRGDHRYGDPAPMTLSRPAVRDLLTSRGLAPRRDLGQNFVADPNTVRRIAHLAGVGPGDNVLEIGAGLGSLTLALAETGADVTAIEIDHGLVDVLAGVVSGCERVTVVEADATALDWHRLLGDANSWVLVANLPYNIATPLVADLLDEVPVISRMLVLVQREVAERLAARPGSSAYGAVSVKVAYWADARIVGEVPASVFVPRPNVDSALVAITRRAPPDVAPEPLFALVGTAFNQRRKMLRRSLRDVVTPDQFAAAGVAPTARPEELDLGDWCRLSVAVAGS